MHLLRAEALQLQTFSTASVVMFCAKGDIPVLSLPNNAAIPGVTSDLAINDISVSLMIDRNGNGQLDGLINALPGCFSGLETTKDCQIVSACLDINFRFAMQNTTCPPDPAIPGDIAKPGFQFGLMSFLPNIRAVGKVCEKEKSTTTSMPSNDQKVLEAVRVSTWAGSSRARSPGYSG